MAWTSTSCVIAGVVGRSGAGRGVLLCGATALAASAAQPDPSARVASWDGGDVTVEEFITYYGYGSETERQPLPSLEAKKAFLEPLINAEMMMQEAESLGITKLPIVADFVRGRRCGTLIETVQTRATQGRVQVLEREVDRIYNKSLTEMEIKEITARTREDADAMMDSIKAGVPFEDLADTPLDLADRRDAVGTWAR